MPKAQALSAAQAHQIQPNHQVEKKDNQDKNKINPDTLAQEDNQTRINTISSITQLPLKLLASPWGRPCRRTIKLHHVVLQIVWKG